MPGVYLGAFISVLFVPWLIIASRRPAPSPRASRWPAIALVALIALGIVLFVWPESPRAAHHGEDYLGGFDEIGAMVRVNIGSALATFCSLALCVWIYFRYRR